MALLYKDPAIATLVHKQTPYRGQWVIYQAANLLFNACHEVQQQNGDCKVVEQISLQSLADAQAFSTYLSNYGWSRVWAP